MEFQYTQSRMGAGRAAMAAFGLFVAVLACLHGCATPVGVRFMDPRDARQGLTRSVLSGDDLSAPTMQILNRSGLAERFLDDPEEVIASLHRGMPTAREADRLFALAELCFLHAARNDDRSYFLAAVVYAYAFIFPRNPDDSPGELDPRLRTAVDLYNQGIARGFAATESGRGVMLKGGTYRLPFGELVVRMEPETCFWGPFRLENFIDAAELEVRGLRNDYRWPGIGTALVATLKPRPGQQHRDFARVPSILKVAATAFLQLDDVTEGLRSGRLEGRLTLYTGQEEMSIQVNGRDAPLEYRTTAALAYTLEGSQVYDLELKGLLSGDLQLIKKTARFRDNVFLLAPYRRGRIPVVFVHGTASSPARWAQMLNEILNDRELGRRYQVWLFTYNTGNPILYSGGILVQGLRNVVRELDPEGRDEALKKMVVIGHSQGGLLARLTVTDSGERFWDNTFAVPMDRLSVSPRTRALLQRSLFYRPLPFVRRVVFIATPHRGSFLVGGQVRYLFQKMISLPFELLDPLEEIFRHSPEAIARRSLEEGVPRSTDNMAPDSEFIRTFSTLPIAPGVGTHSIIAVDNPGETREEWDDGVVTYRSAHIEGATSELVVHSGHSAQDEPQTIEEVRRILMENLKEP
ncbi:MAG: esterase/lipase family protein [Thermodesulfobacteriota bacterium]